MFSEPLEDNIKNMESFAIINKQVTTITIFRPSQGNFLKGFPKDSVLLELEINKSGYYWSFSNSSDYNYKLYLKRDTNSFLINNYYPIL